MKSLYFLVCLFSYSLAYTQTTAIPHLEKKGKVTQLVVRGEPFLMLAGELHNSSTSGAAYMRPIWQQMKRKNLNTVIGAVYWELVEPMEGKFDFSLVDSMINGARKQNLHLVILWFASWKNGYSMYAPGWVKKDLRRFPRALNSKGESFAVLSALSTAAMNADATAFGALMKHIRLVDEKHQTVIMAQLENEVGLFYEPRDYSEEANKAYQQGVPGELLRYLAANKDHLQPELDSAWRANGSKTSGSWEEVFGKSTFDKENEKALSYLPEELFSVYHYSKYIGEVARAGKAAYPIPMFVNAWIKHKGFAWPGKYPSGGPIPHTLDIWRANAPGIDFIAPDIYTPIPEAKYTIEQYNRPGNPVFIPEFRPSSAAANLAFWAFGHEDVNCFSPFGIDDGTAADDPITKAYAALTQVQRLILQHQGQGSMAGIYLDTAERNQTFNLNDYAITASLALPTSAPAGGAVAGLSASDKKVTSAGGIIFAIGPNEFIVVGKDFTLSFTPLVVDPTRPKIDVEYMDEGSFINNKWIAGRRLNGDEGTGGGDYGFGYNKGFKGYLKFPPTATGEYSIIKIKLYKY